MRGRGLLRQRESRSCQFAWLKVGADRAGCLLGAPGQPQKTWRTVAGVVRRVLFWYEGDQNQDNARLPDAANDVFRARHVVETKCDQLQKPLATQRQQCARLGICLLRRKHNSITTEMCQMRATQAPQMCRYQFEPPTLSAYYYLSSGFVLQRVS